MGYQNCTETRGAIPPYDCPGIFKPFGACGFRTDHAVNVFSSPDLMTWTFVMDALPVSRRPNGIYFRPKVIYNPITALFVLWINYLPPAPTPLEAYPNASYIVATSRTMASFFEIVNLRAQTAVSGGGDFTLFVDPACPTHTAYLAYDAWGNNHQVLLTFSLHL